MRKLTLLFAIPLAAQTLTTITHDDANPYLSPIDGQRFYGQITVSTQCRMVRGGVTYGAFRKTYCLGVTGGACDVTTAAGIISLQLVPTDAGTTPTGCYYTAAHNPKSGNAYTDTWTVPASGTALKIKDVRTTIIPSPSARVLLSQVDASALAAGCARVVGGVIQSTGLPCPSANPIPLDVSTSTADCATRTVGQHGFTAGGIVAWATDNSTGEVLRPAVTIDGSRAVTACFATGAAPASWTLNIAGSTGSGLPQYTLLSGDESIPATTHGIYSTSLIGACYSSTGEEFDCLVTVNPSTFAVRVQHTPFLGGSYAVLVGR